VVPIASAAESAGVEHERCRHRCVGTGDELPVDVQLQPSGRPLADPTPSDAGACLDRSCACDDFAVDEGVCLREFVWKQRMRLLVRGHR
jgi:hypothetical protein